MCVFLLCLDDISIVCAASSPITVSEDLTLSADNYGTSDITLGGSTGTTLTTNGYAINNLTIDN